MQSWELKSGQSELLKKHKVDSLVDWTWPMKALSQIPKPSVAADCRWHDKKIYQSLIYEYPAFHVPLVFHLNIHKIPQLKYFWLQQICCSAWLSPWYLYTDLHLISVSRYLWVKCLITSLAMGSSDIWLIKTFVVTALRNLTTWNLFVESIVVCVINALTFSLLCSHSLHSIPLASLLSH